jgi:hypothetical protein
MKNRPYQYGPYGDIYIWYMVYGIPKNSPLYLYPHYIYIYSPYILSHIMGIPWRYGDMEISIDIIVTGLQP